MLRAQIDFSKKLRDWDGFGISYRASETNGFSGNSFLIESLFGHEGLRSAILRIFLGPLNQDFTDEDPSEETQINIKEYKHHQISDADCDFCNSALKTVNKWGGGLKVLVTCLSPPGWMTKQKEISGRDLDPLKRIHYARYMVSYIKFLVDECWIPVKFLSIHNLGDMWEMWNGRGYSKQENSTPNLYWPIEQLVDFVKLVRRLLDRNGFQDIGLTPGETLNWGNFYKFGYASALSDDPQSLSALSILTSNSLIGQPDNKQNYLWNSAGIDLMRERKTDLHAWSTSISSHVDLFSEIYNHIYCTKVNAIILDCSIDNYEIQSKTKMDDYNEIKIAGNNYFFAKPFFSAGQPGMGVSYTTCNGSEIEIIAFSSNSTRNPDSFIIINTSDSVWEIPIEIRGSACGNFQAFRTSLTEKYVKLNSVSVREGKIIYTAPSNSITVFLGTI